MSCKDWSFQLIFLQTVPILLNQLLSQLHRKFKLLQIQTCYIFQNKFKKWWRAGNIALTDLLKYTLEVLNLFGYNTNLLAIYIGTIKNCGNYVQFKVKISDFSPLLLLSLKPPKKNSCRDNYSRKYGIQKFRLIDQNWLFASDEQDR